MAVPSQSQDRSSTATEIPTEDVGRVAHYTTRPGRVVFTELGNTDGWIATNLTVELHD